MQLLLEKQSQNKAVVLIGVSGCGKTRTCHDLCRCQWGLYFDCSVDYDFLELIGVLKGAKEEVKTDPVQTKFEELSEKFIKCLIAT